MTDAEKLTRVLQGLKCCVEEEWLGACDQCPYLISIDEDEEADYREVTCDKERLCADAFDLLKVQEPRLIKAHELQIGNVVFVETQYNNKSWYGEVIEFDSASKGLAVHFWGCNNESVLSMEDYGRYWRCWTSRPTNKQMEVEKWNDE